jgi:hypothetical protein
MKEFIKKLIGGLREQSAYSCGQCMDEAIEVVCKIAEEYNGGWIPCSERLPNKDEYLKHKGRFIVTDGNRTYVTHFDIYETQKFGVPQLNGFCEDNKVIAWMPLPEPYKEGGERV